MKTFQEIMEEESEKHKMETVKHINYKGSNIYLLDIPEFPTKKLKISTDTISYERVTLPSNLVYKFVASVIGSSVPQMSFFSSLMKKLMKKFDENTLGKLTDKETYIVKCYLQQLKEKDLAPNHPLMIEIGMMIINELYTMLERK